jgi:hypothetical protein
MEELEETFKRSRAEFEKATEELVDCQERAKRLRKEMEQLRVEADLAERAVDQASRAADQAERVVGRLESDYLAPSPGTFMSLPDEILTKILFYVDRKTAMCAVPLVNRRLYGVMADPSNLRAVMGISDMDVADRREIMLASISREHREVMRTQPDEVRLVRPVKSYTYHYDLFGKPLDIPGFEHTMDYNSSTFMFKDKLWTRIYDSQCPRPFICDMSTRRITYSISPTVSEDLIVSIYYHSLDPGCTIHVFDGLEVREVSVNRNIDGFRYYFEPRGNVIVFSTFYVVVAGDETGKIVAGEFYASHSANPHVIDSKKTYNISQPSIDPNIGVVNTSFEFLAESRINMVEYCKNMALCIDRGGLIRELYWIDRHGENRKVVVQNRNSRKFDCSGVRMRSGVLITTRYYKNEFTFLQFPWSASPVK